MPIEEEKTEIETRFEEFEDLLRKSGADLIKLENGKTLEEAINDLKKGVGKTSDIPLAPDFVKKEDYEILKQRLDDLEDKIANLKVGGNDIDLTKEFPAELLSLGRTDLEFDEVKPAISPEVLNEALKLDPKGKGVVENFPYPSGRTIPNRYPPLTMRQ